MKTINGIEMTETECYEKNKKLIWSSVKKHMPTIKRLGLEKADLFNEGAIGLIKAYRNFDESYGCAFSTYAVPMISGQAQQFIRDKANIIRYGRRIKDIAYRMYRNDLIERPVKEVAEILGETQTDIETALTSMVRPYSTEMVVFDDGGNKVTLIDQLESKTDYSTIYVQDFMKWLNPVERKIVEMRMQGADQRAIGKSVNISQAHVSRKLRKIGDKHKHYEGVGV